jgi:transmembrane sensor
MSFKSDEIDKQAAEWATRQNLRELTPGEHAEFCAWLTADPRHLGAYGRAEGVLARLERVSGVAISDAHPDPEVETPNLIRRRIILTGSVAASIAAVGVVGASLWRNRRDDMVPTNATFATGVGQTREILLNDGSIITLNTDSQVSVELTAEIRKIKLERGEALFDVAKNKQRPFVVFAGDTQVRAVGTSFTVSMLPKRPLQVLVREGVVEVKRSDTAAVWVGASTRALAPRDAPIVAESITSTKLARNLAWQYGRIALDNQTLQDAADEFARYSDVHIVVDSAVANRTVTGLFASNDPVSFAKAAASVLKLRVEVNDKEVRILERTEVPTVGKS